MPDFLLLAVSTWWSAFLLTLLIELPIYTFLPRGEAGVQRRVAGALLATFVTHPLLWFVWHPLTGGIPFAIPVGEVVICVVETFVFWAIARPMRLPQAAAAAFVANAASYGFGLLIHLAS